MNLINANRNNLISLWQLVNERADVHMPGEKYDYGIVDYSNWPNRLWFHGNLDKKSVEEAIAKISSSSTKITIPYWDIYQNESHTLLEEAGLIKVFEQVGMSLKLPDTYQKRSKIQLHKVSDRESAVLWETLFEKAFKYTISHRLLLKTFDKIDYLIAFHEKEPIGTAMLHDTDSSVIGIHSMGIIPEMRRRGFAEKIMHTLLYDSVKKRYRYVTLQASDMGKGLYLKLGFKEQFLMRNYVLPQNG